MVFFTFPEDARWNNERAVVEFTVLLGEYQGTVRVPRRVFQRLLDQSPTPGRCLEAYQVSGYARARRKNFVGVLP
jgi:hypothetical protein